MFQMINQTHEEPGDRMLLLLKIGMFIVALAALGGVVYFFAFTSYAGH
jgi:cell division septal protein FtsQ